MGRRYGKDGKERQGKALAGRLPRMSAPVILILYFLLLISLFYSFVSDRGNIQIQGEFNGFSQCEI
ncbi:MAG: hypothetical protein IJ742_06205, partial [Prevotella sp.]|nr:hypothetical protein [Prevotella sp.]